MQLSSTLLNYEESISLLDYIVRQVYLEDLPDDPYATSPSAPSMLAGLPALTQAAAITFPPLTSPPHPLHLPTYNLLSTTLAHLSHSTSPAASPSAASTASPAVSAIASQRVLRVLREFVSDWKYSERKLGLKEAAAGEEVVGMGDWLADAAEDEEDGEVETMSMADFLGGPEDDAVEEAEEDDDDERDEHRIDVGRAAESRVSRPAVVKKGREAKEADKLGESYEEEREEEDELDAVGLDELELDEADEENGLDLRLSPTKGKSAKR